MDTNRIKNLAYGMRTSLMKEVAAKLEAVLAKGSPARLDSPDKVRALEEAIREKGKDKVIEANAYTWFNRLCALRYMDARGYTPVFVVTPAPGATRPAILADAEQGIFDPEFTSSKGGLNRLVRDRICAILAGTLAGVTNRTEAAYTELLLAVCAHYAHIFPFLFSEEAASDLLVPSGLLAQGSLLERIVSEMDDETCASVEVLGWLYQFYVAERKQEFFDAGRKAAAEDIAPATQLFTPEWIVRYMVQNTLGRLWMLNNPASGLAQKMPYYIVPDASHENCVRISSPEEITLLDPACGSGHILVYAFDLLFEMYEEEGYLPQDIPVCILEKNLFGFEIDARAAEIASFALSMKARERDPHFFEKHTRPHILVLENVSFGPDELAAAGLLSANKKLLDTFEHVEEVGSLYVPDASDMILVECAIRNLVGTEDLFAKKALEKLERMKTTMEELDRRFSCVVANPPYMGSSKLNAFMKAWIAERYADVKGDLCTCFIRRGFAFCDRCGYNTMITMQSWMFLSTYEKMRTHILGSRSILSMAHLGTRAFDAIGGEVVSTTATVFSNGHYNVEGSYFRLVDFGSEQEKSDKLLEAIANPDCGWFYRTSPEKFSSIPGSPIAYWVGEAFYRAFEIGKTIGEFSIVSEGIKTGDNARFLRLWQEIDASKFSFAKSDTGFKWYPHHKGGNYRKWYGNLEYVINWENDGCEVFSSHNSGMQGRSMYFKEFAGWSKITSKGNPLRYYEKNVLFDSGAPALANDDIKECLALLNTVVGKYYLEVISPTLNLQVGDIKSLPLIKSNQSAVIVNECIQLSKADWDSYETSWDFTTHPLTCPGETRLSSQYEHWKAECEERFLKLKANEEELNRIFIDIYSLADELTPEVKDKDVTVHRVYDTKADVPASMQGSTYIRTKRDEIVSLISYAVGCMFGRYSTDSPGLILADAGQSLKDFAARVPDASFVPDDDAIIPVLNDEWFSDDIVARFHTWLSCVFGKDTLSENIAFIEDALGVSLRTYFVRDFYKDHVQTYKKRPIYWLIQSPKKSFSALVYLHRYTPSTIGLILTRYLREYRDKLTSAAQALSASERAADKRAADAYRAAADELSSWEREVIYPLAQERISLDLDDGVKVNYQKFPGALAKVSGLSG